MAAITAVDPAPASIIPFGALLLAIALAPVFLKHHWERHYRTISAGLGAITVCYYVFWMKAGGEILHVASDYLAFMAIVGSFFAISGGIHIRVRSEARPWVNTLFLLGGVLLGSLIGTTGASMLLIRPWIRMNKYRFTGHHIAFFIFLVSNIGGALVPLGPPLVMGLTKGVPFWWPLLHCWMPWATTTACVLVMFYIVDRVNYLRAPRAIREIETGALQWRIDGRRNLLFIAFALVAVVAFPPGIRELAMVAAAALSYLTTPKPVHDANEFTFAPVREIAWLFAGIFATMIPALDYLSLHAGKLGLHSDMQFYWFSGLLSGVLDNAPTYLAFLAAALGLGHLSLGNPGDMAAFLAQDGRNLAALSLGSSCFGALTYIGNGPNLIVKSIAVHSGVNTPGFLRYAISYAFPVLIPVFLLVSWLFFRG
ncbi:MAG TPA: sodium:proton antiporter [Chthoniobacteraceae bacterium]|nr:sodium:proton antiporter [Chthoniobacteraceae bacterium]